MKKYDSYKDSGIEWIGEIPNHWSNTKIKYTANDKDSLFIDGDWIESKVIEEEGIRYITTGNVKVGNYSEQGNGYISPQTFIDLNCTEVFEGDLIISRLNNPIGRACIIPNLKSRIVTSVDNVIYRPDSILNKKFLLHLFSSNKYFEHTELISRGATMQRISRGMLGNLKIPLPNIEEQNQIAKYLDHKTTKIDNLIAKKEALIQLLEEERIAVINNAVTKGLDPNVPMKDSEVDWLGEIPEHWEVKKLKYLVDCNSNTLSENSEPTQIINYIEIGDVNFEKGITGYTEYCFEKAPSRARRIVHSEDIIVSTVRTYLKAITTIEKEYDGFIASTGFAVLTSKEIYFKFLSYVVLTNGFIDSVISLSKGVSYPSITSQDLLNISICLPNNIDEQQAISRQLDTEISEIDKIIIKTHQEIELLKEYKSALISEVVTGKVDVRNEKMN